MNSVQEDRRSRLTLHINLTIVLTREASKQNVIPHAGNETVTIEENRIFKASSISGLNEPRRRKF